MRISRVSRVSRRILITVSGATFALTSAALGVMASRVMSTTEMRINKLSNQFQKRSLPFTKAKRPDLKALVKISTTKKMVKLALTQNQTFWLSGLLKPVSSPMTMPLRKIMNATIGSMKVMKSGFSRGAATSSTRTFVSSATRRLASPEKSTSRTVRAICCTSSSSVPRISSLRSTSTNALKRMPIERGPRDGAETGESSLRRLPLGKRRRVGKDRLRLLLLFRVETSSCAKAVATA
mmetsp:Transcript_60356/g.186868  ORF Transcript_60356/g.186868 Transcript_60356/m.186868 type:complete len:237 (+) Transcript_60356:529-1239(+)